MGQDLDCRLSASGTVRKEISVVEAPESVVICHGGPGKGGRGCEKVLQLALDLLAHFEQGQRKRACPGFWCCQEAEETL